MDGINRLSDKFLHLRTADQTTSKEKPSGSLTGLTPGLTSAANINPSDDNRFFNDNRKNDGAKEMTPSGVSHHGTHFMENEIPPFDKLPQELRLYIYKFVGLLEGKAFFGETKWDDEHLAEGIARSLSKLMSFRKELVQDHKELLLGSQKDSLFKMAAMAYTDNFIKKLISHYEKSLVKRSEEMQMDPFMDFFPEQYPWEKPLEEFKGMLDVFLQSSKNIFFNIPVFQANDLKQAAFDAILNLKPGTPRTLKISFKNCIGTSAEKISLNEILKFLEALGDDQKGFNFEFSFADNSLPDENLCQFVNAIIRNKLNVSSLDLSGNQILNNTAKAVAMLIENSDLKSLNMEGKQGGHGLMRNQMEQEGIEALFSAISDSKLEQLNLSRCLEQFSSSAQGVTAVSNAKVISFIANKLPYCQSLTHLSLADNGIDCNGMNHLAKGLQGIVIEEGKNEETILGNDIAGNKLHYLDVSMNMGAIPGEEDIHQQVEDDRNYESFGNFLNALKECKHLKFLDISYMGVGYPSSAADDLAESLPSYKTLSTLKMEGWEASSEIFENLVKGILASNLEALVINELSTMDEIGNQSPELLASHIADMLSDKNCSLKKLAVRRCGIGDDVIISIAEKFGKDFISPLTHLDISNRFNHFSNRDLPLNHVSIVGIEKLAALMKEGFSQLTHINLDGNNISEDGKNVLLSVTRPTVDKKVVRQLEFLSTE